MGPPRSSRRSFAVSCAVFVMAFAIPVAALADWPQFQGDGFHNGVIDGPSAPLRVGWSRSDISLEGPNTSGGLSAPVVAGDGTLVVVGPTAVVGFAAADGSDVFSAARDFGPSSQPAIADRPDGAIVVFTEGFGDNAPTGSGTPSPTASDGQGDESFDSHVHAVDLATGEPVWAEPVQLDEIVLTPVAADGEAAYVGDVGGNVTAVELGSGDVRWTVPLGTPVSGAVSIDGDRAFVTVLGDTDTKSVVVALDIASGEELWRTGGEDVSNLVSAPVLVEGRILVTDGFGGIVAFDDQDGRLLWRTEFVNPLSNQLFFVQGVGGAAPVSADGQVFAVDVSGRVYAVDAETGAELWDHALNDPAPSSAPLLTEDHVLVPTDSGKLYALDRATGHLAWRSEEQGAFLRNLADAGDLLIAVTGFDDAGIVAFEADPDGVLIAEPSPTAFDLARLLAGFLAGALPVAVLAVLLTGPLQRRFGPAVRTDAERLDRVDAG